MKTIQQMLSDIEQEVQQTQDQIGCHQFSTKVMTAMRNVPRSAFVPESIQHLAFENAPLPIGHGQTISQPYIVALMTELLQPKPTDRILEVGTGSGYQAAILAQLVQQVYSCEIIPALAVAAEQRLKQLGYKNIKIKTADAYQGWKEEAPYDGILVTAAAPHIPPPLLEQLKPGGHLLIPVGSPYGWQELLLVTKDQQQQIQQQSLLGVVFVPLTGQYGRNDHSIKDKQ